MILDDLMAECAGNERLTTLFAKESYHLNLRIIFVVQNLFYKQKILTFHVFLIFQIFPKILSILIKLFFALPCFVYRNSIFDKNSTSSRRVSFPQLSCVKLVSCLSLFLIFYCLSNLAENYFSP